MRLFSIRGLPALALVLAMPAFGQLPNRLTADIPFPFHLGDDQMPAGKYEIRNIVPTFQAVRFDLTGDMLLPAGDHRTSVRFGTAAVKVSLSGDGRLCIVFNKYRNDRYFVSQIWSDDGTGVTFAKSRRERELIVSKVVAGYPVERVVIKARVAD